MLLIVLACSLSLAIIGQHLEDGWTDPYETPGDYNSEPAPNRCYPQETSLQTTSDQRVVDLQKQIEEQEKRIKLVSQQPSCLPVYERYLRRLQREIRRVGAPTDATEVFYDGKIKLSNRSMAEIEMVLKGEEKCRTGALDNVLSQILVDLRPQEAWKWRFEDTFGVEFDEVLKVGLLLLIVVVIICTEWWSKVSWLFQICRLCFVSFFISFIWNWIYLYKIEFAKHQHRVAKLHEIGEKCSRLKPFTWVESLTEWWRNTFTFQDDHCQEYFESLHVHPCWLVPPTKALSYTIVTFFTDSLKPIGEGIGGFINALLKDLPYFWQIIVFFAAFYLLMVVMCQVVQGAFQHGIRALFRSPKGDPPHLQQPQPQHHLQENRNSDGRAVVDAPHHRTGHCCCCTQTDRPSEIKARVVLEIKHTDGPAHSAAKAEVQQRRSEQNLSAESAGEPDCSAAGSKDQSETKLTEKESQSEDEFGRDVGALKSDVPESQPSQTDNQDQRASAEDRSSAETENVGSSAE